MTTYDPTNPNSRKALATALLAKLTDCGFTEEAQPGCNERIFSRDVGTGIRVAVYTSIEGDAAREVATDAIRVSALYNARDGQTRGVAKAEKRVNRVGNIEDIATRMHERMREVWKLAAHPDRCTCGAPKFTSKKGNAVCADLCWMTLEEVHTRRAPSKRSGYSRRWTRRAA